MASMRDSVSVDSGTMKLYLSIPDGLGPFPAVGINTLSVVTCLPDPSCNVAHPELLSLTHHGVPGPCTSPQPFTRSGSV